MWIFTSTGFVSIVQHTNDPDTLIVRGRFQGDAARFLGLPIEAEEETPSADYRFRCYAHRDVVAAAMIQAADSIRYPNFKDSIIEKWRKSVAMRVWSILYREQSERHPSPGWLNLLSSSERIAP
jgi:hypothetical protein